MNIVVCVKWVISPDNAIRVENGAIRHRGLYNAVNPNDLVAVEEAVRLKALGAGGEVVLITVGPPSAEEGLRRCLAMGADKGMRLWDTAFESLESYTTALILAEAIRHLSYDLVLCGQKSADMENEQVAAILAEFLDIPMVSSAVKIDITNQNNKVLVQRKLSKGNREIVETSSPALLAVEAGLNQPRYPNLRAIFAAQKKAIQVDDMRTLGMNLEQMRVSGEKSKIVAHLPPRPKPKKLFTPDSRLSAAERMRLVMSGGVAQKQGDLLEGDAEYIASNIVRFLSEQKLVSKK